jgi:cell division protease FtsH
MFEQAKKHAPCIVFIDEIDAVGRHRGIGFGGGSDEREQTLNQLLVEMDGFSANIGIIILAATNRPDVLDKALLRPGRFDKHVTIDVPDIASREQILAIHSRKIPLGPDVDLMILAKSTPGFTGADLANLMNEGALNAASKNHKVITMSDLEYAKDRIIMGAERRSLLMTDQERVLTAYHEAGHVIVSIYSTGSDPIHKATIMPRGRALGLVMRLPENDRLSFPREKMIADLMIAMGGRCAEEIIFGDSKVTSGASSDIKQATRLATSMVMEWGMSDEIGMIYYGDPEDTNYGANGYAQRYDISEERSQKISSEIKKLLDDSYNKAKEILNTHIDELHKIAKFLKKYETLSGEEIKRILAGKKIRAQSKKTDDAQITRSAFDDVLLEDGKKSKRNKKTSTTNDEHFKDDEEDISDDDAQGDVKN